MAHSGQTMGPSYGISSRLFFAKEKDQCYTKYVQIHDSAIVNPKRLLVMGRPRMQSVAGFDGRMVKKGILVLFDDLIWWPYCCRCRVEWLCIFLVTARGWTAPCPTRKTSSAFSSFACRLCVRCLRTNKLQIPTKPLPTVRIIAYDCPAIRLHSCVLSHNHALTVARNADSM